MKQISLQTALESVNKRQVGSQI